MGQNDPLLLVLPEIQTTNFWVEITKNKDGHFNWNI